MKMLLFIGKRENDGTQLLCLKSISFNDGQLAFQPENSGMKVNVYLIFFKHLLGYLLYDDLMMA